MAESIGGATSQKPDGPTKKRLNREAWHKPLVSIIVTHHNYSHMVEDALLSILDQTHENWECVIVDDGSDVYHRDELERIVAQICDPRIRPIYQSENRGQALAFFEAFSSTRGEFIAILDPDDRYAESFIEECLAAHLNNIVFAPIVTTDQFILKKESVISGTIFRIDEFLQSKTQSHCIINQNENLHYYPHFIEGWLWTTTSSLMFRRGAIEVLRPRGRIRFRHSIDAYLAPGVHRLGGTIRLSKPLVYRLIHDNNHTITNDVYSMSLGFFRDGAVDEGRLAIEELEYQIGLSGVELPPMPISPLPPSKRLIQKWKNSFRKRWNRITSKSRQSD